MALSRLPTTPLSYLVLSATEAIVFARWKSSSFHVSFQCSTLIYFLLKALTQRPATPEHKHHLPLHVMSGVTWIPLPQRRSCSPFDAERVGWKCRFHCLRICKRNWQSLCVLEVDVISFNLSYFPLRRSWKQRLGPSIIAVGEPTISKCCSIQSTQKGVRNEMSFSRSVLVILLPS